MAGVKVREANKTDAKKIHELMQQHAAEQNTVLPSHLTYEGLTKGGWGPGGVVVALVAESKRTKEGELDGFILAHHAYAPWFGHALFIKEVFVVPAARRSGVATKLCRELLQAAVSMGCKQCDMWLHQENEAAVALFKKLGADNITVSEDWHIFSLDIKMITGKKVRAEGQGRTKIRLAGPEDMPSVMTMIQELADYEEMPDAPKINSQTLVTDLHSTLFECFVAEDESGTLVGYAMFYPTFSSQGHGMCLEDYYVKPSHRGQGLGTSLMTHVAERGLKLGARHLEFVVLSWNTPAITFYKQKNATDLTASMGLQLYRFDDLAMRKCVQQE